MSTGPISPDAWTFDINSQAYVITGAEVDFGGPGITNNAAAGTIRIADIIGGSSGVVQNGGGTLRLEGSNTYSGGTSLTGGTLDLAGETDFGDGDGGEEGGFGGTTPPPNQLRSAAAGTGTITFNAPRGATLAIEQGALIGSGTTATFYNPIAGFAAAQNGGGADTIDLRGLSNGTATFDASTGHLNVSGMFMGAAETEVLTLQGSFSGLVFNTASDGNGGTNVTLAAPSSPGSGTGGGGSGSTPPPAPTPSSAPVPAPPAVAPTITGTHSTTDTAEQPVLPFAASAAGGPVTIGDGNAGATDNVAITLTGGGGTLSGAGLTGSGNSYALAAADPATLTSELDALQFKPANGTPSATEITTLALTVTSSAGTLATDNRTAVTDTAAPTDAVAIAPQVTYKDGVFTLTGTASSTAGVAGVEIFATVDDGTQPQPEDLGAATVNADGSFTFRDAVGDQQSFFQARLTDNAGGTATSADPGFNLKGGLGPQSAFGQQNSFSPTEQVSSTLFRPDSTRQVNLMAPGQTVDLQPYDSVFARNLGHNTFVYTPAAETGSIDVIRGFKARGADHDVLSLPGADFGNSIAEVLRNTGDVGGNAWITDPVTGDSIRLAGVSTAELQTHPKDFTFHA